LIKAVVFDFDGVIANSEPLHYAAFRDVLQELDVPFTEQEYYASYLGYDDVGVFRAVAEARGLRWPPERIGQLVRRKAVRLEALERERSVLFPGAADAIARLAAALPLAIASGALRAEILRVLHDADLARFFHAVVAAEDTPRSKPAPDPYLRAVSLLSASLGQPFAPHECVAIEDSRWGLDSARAAGLRTIAVTHTYPADSFGAVDLTIDSLDALTVANVAGM
jgi:HAD superfamily hydrolase (TIGR01509 family)